MGIEASARRILVFTAALAAIVSVTSATSQACDSQSCASRQVVAQAQPATSSATNARPAAANAPVSLKTFTKTKSRSASRQSARAQKARIEAARKAKQNSDNNKDAADIASEAKKVAPVVANANAELIGGAAGSNKPVDENPIAPAAEQPAPQAAAAVQVVEPEELNDVDKAAWAANAHPRTVSTALLDSRAEMHDDDSKWAQTSTIGKIFVAFGALLTLGSAIRMFLA